MPIIKELPFTLGRIREGYVDGLRAEQVIEEAFRRYDLVADPGIFISQERETAFAEARALGTPDDRPLWGVPYVVKDNINVAGMSTTAACPDFAGHAAEDAFVVARLRAAGAICLGKTNLDQFATGLVGVRTPYPVPRNALDSAIVPGGSSSGSAVAVAHGFVTFALGTDTAGSGRVPAALNSIIGLKPTLGALSATGVVPACRTLDTVSVFAMTVVDAWEVYSAIACYDVADAYSRPIVTGELFDASSARIGVPDGGSLWTFGDEVQAADFRRTVEKLRKAGAIICELDFAPFHAIAGMLYEGAWLAERVAAVGDRLTQKPETLHPTTRAILEQGLKLSAVDAFEGYYKLQALRRECEALLTQVDALCVPTIPNFVTTTEIAADPIGPNSRLGTYTNFVNLLDLCGIAVPTGDRADGRPGSVTFLAQSCRDALCASLATTIEAGRMGASNWARPGTPQLAMAPAAGEIALAVCGAHMSGLPLNHELTERRGRLLRACRTAPVYRLHALAGGPPFRPGLVRQTSSGASIALEVWAMPRSRLGDFMAGVPSPLAIGMVELEDGTSVKGFLCEEAGVTGALDITDFGGWRAFLAATTEPAAGAAA